MTTQRATMLTMVGVSHRNAPLGVRERFAIPADALPAVRHEVAERFGAGAIVATCNRLELYVPDDHPPEELAGFLCEAADVAPDIGERYLLPRRDDEAVSHLYAVAAGIDSMVVGESEILGQVRGPLPRRSRRAPTRRCSRGSSTRRSASGGAPAARPRSGTAHSRSPQSPRSRRVSSSPTPRAPRCS